MMLSFCLITNTCKLLSFLLIGINNEDTLSVSTTVIRYSLITFGAFLQIELAIVEAKISVGTYINHFIAVIFNNIEKLQE